MGRSFRYMLRDENFSHYSGDQCVETGVRSDFIDFVHLLQNLLLDKLFKKLWIKLLVFDVVFSASGFVRIPLDTWPDWWDLDC